MTSLRGFIQAHPDVVLHNVEYGVVPGARLERECNESFLDNAPILVRPLYNGLTQIGVPRRDVDDRPYTDWWKEVRP